MRVTRVPYITIFFDRFRKNVLVFRTVLPGGARTLGARVMIGKVAILSPKKQTCNHDTC
jgi:hypothetical protein